MRRLCYEPLAEVTLDKKRSGVIIATSLKGSKTNKSRSPVTIWLAPLIRAVSSTMSSFGSRHTLNEPVTSTIVAAPFNTDKIFLTISGLTRFASRGRRRTVTSSLNIGREVINIPSEITYFNTARGFPTGDNAALIKTLESRTALSSFGKDRLKFFLREAVRGRLSRNVIERQNDVRGQTSTRFSASRRKRVEFFSAHGDEALSVVDLHDHRPNARRLSDCFQRWGAIKHPRGLRHRDLIPSSTRRSAYAVASQCTQTPGGLQ